MDNIISLTIQRLRTSKVTAVFFVFGFTISILLISFNTSFVFNNLNASEFKKENMPPGGVQYVLSTAHRGTISKEQVEELFKGIRAGTGVIINGIMAHPDAAPVNAYAPVSVEYFTEGVSWHYPLKKGRYYTPEELQSGKAVALAGESVVSKFAEEKDGKYMLKLGNKEYEIVGTVGSKSSRSLWEGRIFIPYSALPSDIADDFFWGDESLNFILYNQEKSVNKDIQIIRANARKFLKKCHIKKVGKLESDDMSELLMRNVSSFAVMAVLGYLATLVYAVNILMYWLRKMRFEIGLRKSCGYTNREIFGRMYKEVFGMCLVSASLSLILQETVGMLMEKTGDIYFELSPWNFLIAVAICLVSSFIILLAPFRRLAAIQPVEIIRGE